MEVEFKKYKDLINLNKVRTLRGYTLYNHMSSCYNYKGFFESGGRVKRIVLGRKTNFIDLGDFIVHYFCINNINGDEINLPDNFYNMNFNLEPLSKNEFKDNIDSLFSNLSAAFINVRNRDEDSYLRSLFSVKFELNEFVKGYYINKDDPNGYFISEHQKCYIFIIDELI